MLLSQIYPKVLADARSIAGEVRLRGDRRRHALVDRSGDAGLASPHPDHDRAPGHARQRAASGAWSLARGLRGPRAPLGLRRPVAADERPRRAPAPVAQRDHPSDRRPGPRRPRRAATVSDRSAGLERRHHRDGHAGAAPGRADPCAGSPRALRLAFDGAAAGEPCVGALECRGRSGERRRRLRQQRVSRPSRRPAPRRAAARGSRRRCDPGRCRPVPGPAQTVRRSTPPRRPRSSCRRLHTT